MFYVFTQFIGLIGLFFSLFSFQQKERKWLMVCQLIASLSFSLQLFLLGGITGACLDIISSIRTLVFANRNKHKWASSYIWLILFVFLMIAIGIITWSNAYSILPIIGSVLSTIALWMKEEKKIRLISLSVGPFWLVYNLVNGAVTGALNEVIAMISIIIGIVRCDLKSSKK